MPLSQASLELVVRHPTLSWRLHLERNEAAFLDTRAPHDHVAPAERRPRADVRRQCAHDPHGLLRVVEVELPVGGTDLLGVRDTVVRLRLEPRLFLREHTLEQ